MTTKIKIDLTHGVLEAEGSESFVQMIYSDFKEQVVQGKGTIDDAIPAAKAASVPRKGKSSATEKSPVTKTKKTSNSAGNLLKNLDLSGKGKAIDLREFCGRYIIKTNLERNLVFTYYLQNELEEKDIGIDHIFTCYRYIPSMKIPGNLKQSLYDTSSKGWLQLSSIDDGIEVLVAGTNYIEHDLPKSDGTVE